MHVVVCMYVVYRYPKKSTMGTAYYSWCLILYISIYRVQSSAYTCPAICYCDALQNSVDCKGRELSSIPDGIFYEVSIILSKWKLIILTNFIDKSRL